MTITLDIQLLSKEIHLSIKTIRTTLVRNPAALPPRLLICGQKKLLWLRDDVENFYKNQIRKHGSNPDFSTHENAKFSSGLSLKLEKRKRGRPTKAEQIAFSKVKK